MHVIPCSHNICTLTQFISQSLCYFYFLMFGFFIWLWVSRNSGSCLLSLCVTVQWYSTWLPFVSPYYKILPFKILSSSTKWWDKARYVLPTCHFRPKMESNIPSCTQMKMFHSPLISRCLMGQIYRLLWWFYTNYLMKEEEKK